MANWFEEEIKCPCVMKDKVSTHKIIVIEKLPGPEDEMDAIFWEDDYRVQVDDGKILVWKESYILRHFKPTGERVPDIIGALYD